VPLDKRAIELATLIQRRFNINASSADIYIALVNAFQVEAFQYGKEVEVFQFSHANVDTKTLYVSCLDEENVLKITENGIQRVKNGEDGVFFRDPEHWQPWKFVPENYEKGISKLLLVDDVNFVATEALTKADQALLFEMWIKSLFIDSEVKPLLALIGPSESGKTTLLECVKTAFAGRMGKAETISKEDAFKAAVAAEPLFIIDNLDQSEMPWLTEALCAASTGAWFTLRALYVNNKKYSAAPRAYIAMTSTNVDFAQNKSTVANRSLILEIEPHDLNRDPVSHRAFILRKRDEILTDLVMQFPDYIKAWKAEREVPQTRFRMAPFELLTRRFQPEQVEALFEKLTNAQRKVEAENNPLFVAIDRFFSTNPEKNEVSCTAEDLRVRIERVTGQTRWTTIGIGKKIGQHRRSLTKRYNMTHKQVNGVETYFFQRPATEKKEGDKGEPEEVYPPVENNEILNNGEQSISSPPPSPWAGVSL
jgi:energy-coupling factor transporter ATP-binding protein EcfA2